MSTSTSIEKFKEFSQKYWSKRDTGDSIWGGIVRPLMYAPYLEGKPFDGYKSVSPGVSRRRALPGSDVGKSWWDFDLKYCFRMDVYCARGLDILTKQFSRNGPILTLKNLNELQPMDERNWNNPNFYSNYRDTTPVIEPTLEIWGTVFIGSDFSWMYRTWLQQFFMLNGVEQYDIEKGVKLTNAQPANDPIWENPNKPSTVNPTVPYEPQTNPTIPLEEEVDGDGEGEGETNISPAPSPSPPPPPSSPSPAVIDFKDEPEILLPLLTIMEKEIEKTVKDFMDCLTNKENLQQKRENLCKAYNDLLQGMMKTQAQSYQVQSFQMQTHLQEEIESLKALCKRYESQQKKIPGVAQTISRLKAKGKNVHNIKTVSGAIPPITLEPVANKEKPTEKEKEEEMKEAKRKLKLLIDDMKSECNSKF